jgi:hypothetical protein
MSVKGWLSPVAEHVKDRQLCDWAFCFAENLMWTEVPKFYIVIGLIDICDLFEETRHMSCVITSQQRHFNVHFSWFSHGKSQQPFG